MNWFSSDILKVLWFLLPGFVAAWTFAGLTRLPKLTEFERVIQSLVFTLFVQIAMIVLRAGVIDKVELAGGADGGLVWSLIIALLLGVAFAIVANHDLLHWLLRKMWITKQTAYPSEWVRAFTKRGRTFVVLHLSGKRRLMGWVEEWPVQPREGHLTVERAAWLVGTDSQPLTGVTHILVPAAEVAFVEFLEKPSRKRSNRGKETSPMNMPVKEPAIPLPTETPAEVPGRRGGVTGPPGKDVEPPPPPPPPPDKINE